MATVLEERKQGAVQTTDATKTTVITCPMPDNSVILFDCFIVGLKSDGSQGAGYKIGTSYRRTGAGNATIIGTPTKNVEHEDDVNWDASSEASGANILITVTGKAATTVNWCAYGRALTYTP